MKRPLHHELAEPIRDPAVQDRMRTAFDLFAAAEEMMRSRLRREDPKAPEGIIEHRLVQWLRSRPHAPAGDASGPDFAPTRRTFEWTTGSSKR